MNAAEFTARQLTTVPERGALIDPNGRGEIDVPYFVQTPTDAGFPYAWGAPGPPAEPLTAEQIEEERVEKSAERKALIANNKAWTAAETVRREWIATVLSRKTLPKDADQGIALGLTAHRFSRRR